MGILTPQYGGKEETALADTSRTDWEAVLGTLATFLLTSRPHVLVPQRAPPPLHCGPMGTTLYSPPPSVGGGGI